MVTIDTAAVGRMSCNPAIGGLAKGQIVKEIDVLGGVMPQATDHSALQYKILNRSKGKSVWSPRAQVDKRTYESFITSTVNKLEHVTLIEGEVVDVKLNLKKADMGDVVKDFYKSDAPQFKGKTKKERQKMAIAAKLSAERGER